MNDDKVVSDLSHIGIKEPVLNNDIFEAKLALSQEEKRLCHEIRYSAYHQFGFVDERDDGLFSDRYDDQQNYWTIIVFKNEIPSATIRVALYDPENPDDDFHSTQAMEIFDQEIKTVVSNAALPGRSGKSIELGKLARSRSAESDLYAIFAAFRAAGYIGLHYDVDAVLNAVRRHHMPVYRRFGFRILEQPRPYPGLNFETGLIGLFRDDYAVAKNKVSFMSRMSPHDIIGANLMSGKKIQIFI